MADNHTPQNPPSSSKVPTEIKNGTTNTNTNSYTNFSGQRGNYPNPPESANPDPATLREQWRFAIKQYSRWYSHAWGTAIFAGLSFFALGWIIKGSNPLPSFSKSHDSTEDDNNNKSK